MEAEAQVLMPAIGLMIAGAVTCVGFAAWASVFLMQWLSLPHNNPSHEPYLIFVFLFFMGIILGAVNTYGAWGMVKLRSYEFAVLSSFLAMLPVSYGALIGLPVGIWALRILKKPEVRAAFLVRKAEAKPRRRATPESQPKPFFTTTGWAILLCLLGVADTLLPWQNYKTRAVDANAFLMEQGVLLVVAYVALGLLLITTYTGDPVRVWKPAVLFAAAGFILMALLTYVDRVKQPLASTYYAFACAIGLYVVGAVQVRQILNRRKEGPS
jgi:hypothetical protein